jgi:hypothetical protein
MHQSNIITDLHSNSRILVGAFAAITAFFLVGPGTQFQVKFQTEKNSRQQQQTTAKTESVGTVPVKSKPPTIPLDELPPTIPLDELPPARPLDSVDDVPSTPLEPMTPLGLN